MGDYKSNYKIAEASSAASQCDIMETLKVFAEYVEQVHSEGRDDGDRETRTVARNLRGILVSKCGCQNPGPGKDWDEETSLREKAVDVISYSPIPRPKMLVDLEKKMINWIIDHPEEAMIIAAKIIATKKPV